MGKNRRWLTRKMRYGVWKWINMRLIIILGSRSLGPRRLHFILGKYPNRWGKNPIQERRNVKNWQNGRKINSNKPVSRPNRKKLRKDNKFFKNSTKTNPKTPKINNKAQISSTTGSFATTAPKPWNNSNRTTSANNAVSTCFVSNATIS